MDGYAVCRELKADPRTRRHPGVFLTSLRLDAAEESSGSAPRASRHHESDHPPIVLARVSPT